MSAGPVAAAPSKNATERSRVVPAPGGSHCPITPTGSGSISGAEAAPENGLPRNITTNDPAPMPGGPSSAAQPAAETLRNEELSGILREGYGGVREARARIVVAYQDAGTMRSDVSPDHVARTMIATVLGFIPQQSLFGAAPVEVLGDGLRALMSVSPPLPPA